MIGSSAPNLSSWGALPVEGGIRFRIWAPGVDALSLHLRGQDLPMERETDAPEAGWFSLTTEAEDGDPYGFRLPDGRLVPDPAARAQVGDVHGLSRVDLPLYDWKHPQPDRSWFEAVIYECHIGTFTEEGTFRAAIDKLDHLADLGVTMLEILPVAQFAGDRGWGYDGVLLYAPHPAYGTPDDLRALVDAAHGKGLMVIMDVVYNHFGPDGNYLDAYAADFFDEARHTPWGAGIDYTETPVRRFFIDNALMWIDDYRMDGLRMDAIDHVRDPKSDMELLEELAREVHDRIHHPVHLTTEDNRNVTFLHERAPDGSIPIMAGEWNDDWHNAAHVVLTGETEGYYEGFAGAPVSMLAKSAAHGFSTSGAEGHGVDSAHLPPDAFIDFLQNHDQTGNRAAGDRLTTLADPELLAAMQAMLLLSPHVPMIFMGEEYGETRPFLFFADFEGELGAAVTRGRRKEFEHFRGFTAEDVPDPIARQTFLASKLDWAASETEAGQATLARIRDLLATRAAKVVPLLPGTAANCGTILEAPEGCVAVDWTLNGATLHLRANLSDTARTLPPAGGDLIHLTGAGEGAPRSCAFRTSR